MDLYAEEIISHFEHPHNKGKLENATCSMHEYNPLCGDELSIYLDIKEEKIKDIRFEGRGCAISMATASMLTDEIKGKEIKEVNEMNVKSIIKILGIDPGPARLKCATLALRTVKEAIFIYQHKEIDEETKNL